MDRNIFLILDLYIAQPQKWVPTLPKVKVKVRELLWRHFGECSLKIKGHEKIFLVREYLRAIEV